MIAKHTKKSLYSGITNVEDLLLDLLNIGRDANGSVKELLTIGTFTVGQGEVKRVDNTTLRTSSLIFPLTAKDKDGNQVTVLKFAKLRSNASLDAPEYRVYLGELTADLKDTNGNFYTNEKGEEVGKKGDKDFYAESIGGTPRPSADNTTPLDSTVPPTFGS